MKKKEKKNDKRAGVEKEREGDVRFYAPFVYGNIAESKSLTSGRGIARHSVASWSAGKVSI